jgi:Protein of unknown function (DUF3237)
MTEFHPSRRQVLTGLTVAWGLTALPAQAEAPVPTAPPLTFVYEALVRLSPDVPHGKTPRGERFRAPIVGGDFEGVGIRGKIVPGGADWQLLRADDWFELDAGYFMETDDGVQIHVRNRGLWHSPNGEWPADYAYTTPEFEVPNGRYEWLNRSVFVGTVGPSPDSRPAVVIRVWRVG